jgi:hypothetical protein
MLDLDQIDSRRSMGSLPVETQLDSRKKTAAKLQTAIEQAAPLELKEWSQLLFFISQLENYNDKLDLYLKLSEKMSKEQVSQILFDLEHGNQSANDTDNEVSITLGSRLITRLKAFTKSQTK